MNSDSRDADTAVGRQVHPADGPAGVAGSSVPGRAHLAPLSLKRLLLGSAVALILLAVAMRGVELEHASCGLLQADPSWVGLALQSVLLTTAAKACRWHGLFPSTQQPGLFILGRAFLIGQLANALLPARAGEIARAYVIGAGGEFSRATALGTIAAEKVFDLVLLLVCSGIVASLALLPSWLDVSLVGLAAGGLLLLILTVSLPQQRVLDRISRWPHRLPWGAGEWLTGSPRRGQLGLTALRDPRMASIAGGWSAAVWALSAATKYLLFRAFDLHLSAGAALLLLVLLHVGTAPPSTPAWLGVFHAITLLGLATFGVARATSLAYATVLHAVVTLPRSALGAVALGLSRVGA